MGMPAAKMGDKIVSTDIHIVMVPSPSGSIPTPIPHMFNGTINDGVSSTVMIEGQGAAVQGSKAANSPAHIPQGGPSFQNPPSNQASIMLGSSTVFIDGKPAARNGDTAMTCNDPADLPSGTVIASGTVLIG